MCDEEDAPVANTPKEMLEFLADRLEYAGVSDIVAKSYASDIRKILAEHYDVSLTFKNID
jgi:hypothetical protein